MLQTYVNQEFEQMLSPGVLQSHNILVAEDDETNFFLIKEYLEFSKVNLVWAQNGKEAVEIIHSREDIDLVLMDIQMPVMNGFEALKAIKASYPLLPVIAITAYAVVGDRERGLRAGFNEYLSKPVTRKILMENILKCL